MDFVEKDVKKEEIGWIAQDVVEGHAKIKAKHEAAKAADEAEAKAHEEAKAIPVGFVADDVKKRHEIGFIARDVKEEHKKKMHDDFVYD
jgi:hypothetical protein